MFAFDLSMLQHRATSNVKLGLRGRWFTRLWYRIEAEKQTHMAREGRGSESSNMEAQLTVDPLWSDRCHWATIGDDLKHLSISTPRSNPQEDSVTLPSLVASSRHEHGSPSQDSSRMSEEYEIHTSRHAEHSCDCDSTASVMAGSEQNMVASSLSFRRRGFGWLSFGGAFLQLSRFFKCTSGETNDEKLITLTKMQEFLQGRAAKLNLKLDVPEPHGFSSC